MVAPITIDGFSEIADILDTIGAEIDDLKPLFLLLANDFYKDEQRIFKLKGPGKYPDLSDKYKIAKRRTYGFVYPILKAEGDLMGSLTNPSHPNAVRVINEKQALLGTSDPKARFHASTEPRRVIPYRPIWEIDTDSILGKRWRDTTDAYFEKMLGRSMKNPRRGKRNF